MALQPPCRVNETRLARCDFRRHRSVNLSSLTVRTQTQPEPVLARRVANSITCCPRISIECIKQRFAVQQTGRKFTGLTREGFTSHGGESLHSKEGTCDPASTVSRSMLRSQSGADRAARHQSEIVLMLWVRWFVNPETYTQLQRQ